MSSEEEGRIQQGTIAQFMRKRTQLVGFEFGYWKHVQYVAEFLDNALDAIETFQWNELSKSDSKVTFTLDQELSLENLSYAQDIVEPKIENDITIPKAIDESSLKELEEQPIEVEEEVKKIMEDFNEFIRPVLNIVDDEPIIIIRFRESEPPSFLTSELSQKNVMNYTFEIFDNGIGMSKGDLRKFGKYLASSKSAELKQTRGSQGFGAPSAFSDAQNTTGKAIITISKNADIIYATVSEFFTTSKNEKRYLVHPTEVDSQFMHGTYVRLNYLNVKYVRGYVDLYIKETALMNPHCTIIFVDPYGDEWIYPRLVSSFPKEPKYAKPHPSSTNIGDLQDMLSKSENHTLSAFLQENFVRVSSRTAKDILSIAERDLQDKKGLLILEDGFVTLPNKKSEDNFYIKYEKRVYGRSEKPRDKLVIYKMESEELSKSYMDLVEKYNQLNRNLSKANSEIKKYNSNMDAVDTKKDKRDFEKKIESVLKEIEKINDQKENLKKELQVLIKDNQNGLIEQKKSKNKVDIKEVINEVLITKAKPSELTNEQFNSLFHAFKSVKYMAPPTDTAIPIGETVLENTLIKEIGLKVSERFEDFEIPEDEVKSTIDIILSRKQKEIEAQSSPDKSNTEIKIEKDELINLNSKLLSGYEILVGKNDKDNLNTVYSNNIKQTASIESYQELFDYFIESYSREDDFISAETRPPTSGKGLSYIVEAALAYCNDPKKLETPKRSRDVLSRFVNRTPKLRDSADCAITKAVQSVNWKNYKLEVFENNLPKGPIKLIVNVSGPYVHLMFKSQSKNALADDEELIKEIKYCLEAIGRRLRVYLNRKATIKKRERRASLIENYIPVFVNSIYNIIENGKSRYKGRISVEELENSMRDAIRRKVPVPPPKKEAITAQKVFPKKEVLPEEVILKEPPQEIYPYEHVEKSTDEVEEELVKLSVKTESKVKIQSAELKEEKGELKPKKKVKEKVQTTLPIITTDTILMLLSPEWQNITHLIFKLKIKDMMDARYLQNKLKELERKGKIDMTMIKNKKHWKLK